MDPIRLTYDVPVSQAAAFYLFVGEIGKWWPGVSTHDPARYEAVIIEGRVGGSVATRAGGNTVVWGEVVELVQPTVISWRQWWKQSAEHPSVITARFDEIETGARLKFQHGGWNQYNVHHRQRFLEWPIIMSHYVAYTRTHARRGPVPRRPTRGVA